MKRAAAWLGGFLMTVGVLFGSRRWFDFGFSILDRAFLGPTS